MALLGALAAFLPALHALDPEKSVFQFNVQNWSRQTGLPVDKISSVAQTKDGYVWLGTQAGLVRFDGQEFKVVPIDLPEAQGQEVIKIESAADGKVWFAIGNGGYGSYDGHDFSPIGDNRWNAPDRSSNAILAARDGSIWTGSVSGWGRWLKGSPAETFFDETLGSVVALGEDSLGRVWLGTAEHGLYYWANGRLTLLPDEDLKQRNIYSIILDPAGDLWVATSGGIYRYDRAFHRKEIFFPVTQTNVLLVDRHGKLWAGTSGAGLGRFDDGKFTLLQKSDGLGSDVVTSLYEDTEGSLWVGTIEGLSQLTDLKFPIYSAKEGLLPGQAVAVAASPRGGLWIGLASGASYFDGHAATNYNEASYLPNRYTRRVFEARNGDVYLGDGSRNVSILIGGRLAASFTADQWPEAFAEDATGVLVGIGPNLFRLRDGHPEPYHFAGATPIFSWFNSLHTAKDGAIWAGTNNGLYRIKDGQVKGWSTAEGLSSNRIHFVIEDIDGSIWGGLPNGLVRIKDNKLTTITTADGLADDRIYAIVPDDHGSFWLYSGRGILRISRQNLTDFAEGRVRRIACDIFDGVESVKFIDRSEQGYSACKTLDGRIWFPGPAGVVMVDPAHYFTNQVPPRVYVQKVRVKGRDLPNEQTATLPVGDRSVEFFFTALSYIAPKKIHLRYQLEGFDPAWIDASAHRSVVYNNLPAGRYTFQVQAANADSVWNKAGAAFRLDLPPPYPERLWFYALGAGALALAVFGGYRWKVRRLHDRQKKLQAENDRLERKVGERTSELARSLSLLNSTIESVTDGIVVMDLAGKVIFYNTKFAAIWQFPADLLDRRNVDEMRAYSARQLKEPEKFLGEIMARHASPEGEAFDLIELKDGRIFERYIFPQLIDRERVGSVINWRDVTERKRAEAELHQIHRQLLDVSRHAGMAEVATGVLHNVGNVLNSVNVSATLVADQVRHTRALNIAKLAALFDQHKADLAGFLTKDTRGQQIPAYLGTLAESLAAEHKTLLTELDHLRRNIEHIKDIVSMQQSYARPSGVSEIIAVTDMIEDALRINAGSLARHEVTTIRDYQVRPVITTDKHKAMQILINLVRNAKHACDESARSDKQITVRLTGDDRRVQIAISDNGIGIPAENLTRIFNHGFTTKATGHGFGLHSGALAAKELGGALTVQSDGPGHGATFILELPCQPATPAAALP